MEVTIPLLSGNQLEWRALISTVEKHKKCITNDYVTRRTSSF